MTVFGEKDNMKLCEFLKIKREESGLSKKKVSRMLLAKDDICLTWERGEYKPRGYHIILLSKIYGFDIEDLLELDEFRELNKE